MAVAIDEMDVQVQQPTPNAPSGAPQSQGQEKLELKSALEILRERELRLQAD